MTPAEELRAAAKVMRERAQAASPGPWETCGRGVEQTAGDYADVLGQEVSCLSYCYGGAPIGPKQADADYIASMHPGIALAIADWLDEEAAEYEALDAGAQAFLAGDKGGDVAPAIAVARTYLGTKEEAPNA